MKAMAGVVKSFLKHVLIWLLTAQVLALLYLTYRQTWSLTLFCDTVFQTSLIIAGLGCLMVSGNESARRNPKLLMSQTASFFSSDNRSQDEEDHGKTIFIFLAMFASAVLVYFETIILKKFI